MRARLITYHDKKYDVMSEEWITSLRQIVTPLKLSKIKKPQDVIDMSYYLMRKKQFRILVKTVFGAVTIECFSESDMQNVIAYLRHELFHGRK